MSSTQVAALLRRHDCVSPDPLADGLAELPADAPALPGGFVARPGLVARLTGQPESVLILIVAPPGYGKSTLLAEWADADERPFVWLGPVSAGGLYDPAEVHRLVARPHGRRDPRHVFALDDAHLLEPDLLRQLVCEVLTELPPGSTLALTSRTELELPRARLRTYRDVAELRAGDLAMDAPEAERLLAGAGLELGPDEVRSLSERTQGWPAALYLAGLSASADLEANFGWAPGDGLALAEYLRDEVLSALPQTLMRVARRSSVLEELSPSACDAVLYRHGSPATSPSWPTGSNCCVRSMPG